jgi:hypothetical protein
VESLLLAIKLLGLILTTCMGPGLLIVRKLAWSPTEKLCGVFAASFVAVYLSSFALYGLNSPAAGYWAMSAVFGVMGVLGWPTAKMLVCRRSTRATLLAFVAVFSWEFLHLAMVRAYGGGNWQGDWREHYDRTQFFLHRFPTDYLFLDKYLLPARPPMMNVMAAFFCRQVGMTFQSFSLTFLFLNAWAFIPCCLLLRIVSARAARLTPVIAILFMLNPSILQNSTLTVTKAFAAGLVVLGVCLYLLGLRRDRFGGIRIPAAAVCLAAAVLVHYSACPFAVAIGLHYLFTLVRRSRPFSEAICSAALAGGLLLSWFAYAAVVFGSQSIASGVETTGMAAVGLGANASRVLYNMFTSIVPHPFHPPMANQRFNSLKNWDERHNYFFMMWQTTLSLMVGISAGPVAFCILIKRLWLSDWPRRWERRFWLFYLPFTFVVGIAVNYGRDIFGVAHVTLQSMAMMGTTLLAAFLMRQRLGILILVLIGLSIDYSLGIFLHFNRESHVFPTTTDSAGQLTVLFKRSVGRPTAAMEYLVKLERGFVFWGDHLRHLAIALQILSVIIAISSLLVLVRFYKSEQQRLIR